jgi:hypothetical protein
MISKMETLYFNNCTVLVDPNNGWCDTKFDDGTDVPAFPNDDVSSRYTAQELGYGSDLVKMTLDHEFLHTFLCEKAGLPYSPTLWSVAHNHIGSGCIPFSRQYEEEALVLSCQKYMNTKQIEKPLEQYLDFNRLSLRPLCKEFMMLSDFT